MSVHQQLVWWKHSRTETQAQLPAVWGEGSGALRQSQPPSGQLQVLREGGQQSSGRSCTGAQSWRGLTRLASMNWGQSEGEVGSRPMAWNLQRARPSPTRLASSHVSFCRTACSPLSFWNTGGRRLKYIINEGVKQYTCEKWQSRTPQVPFYPSTYRIVAYFHGVQIFIIFVVSLQIMTTHQQNFSPL